MSATTGRMSRADAQSILTSIRATLPEFSTPDASPQTLQEVSEITADHGVLQDAMDRGHGVNAPEIRKLRTRVAALQSERYLRSTSTPPRVTTAVCVTLYGEDARILGDQGAADLAAQNLALPSRDYVRLQDASHVRTATLTGTRYIFTTQAP